MKLQQFTKSEWKRIPSGTIVFQHNIDIHADPNDPDQQLNRNELVLNNRASGMQLVREAHVQLFGNIHRTCRDWYFKKGWIFVNEVGDIHDLIYIPISTEEGFLVNANDVPRFYILMHE